MENENDVVINNEDKELEAEEEQSDVEEESKSEEKPQKRQFTDEEKLRHHEGIANRLKKKLGISDEPAESKNKSVKKETTDELDYGQKAFLRSYDIKGADEIALVKDWVKRTGDSLDVAVEDEIFQQRLTKLREARTAKEAIPKGKNRTVSNTQDESYWLDKIDNGQASLADIQDVSMRRKVLNARIEKEKTGSRFSDNPVA